jgi:hypothetical protein
MAPEPERIGTNCLMDRLTRWAPAFARGQKESRLIGGPITRASNQAPATFKTSTSMRRSVDFRRPSSPLVPAVSFWIQWKFRLFILRVSMCKSGTYPEPDAMPSITLEPRNFR